MPRRLKSMDKTKLSDHKKVGDILHTPFTGSFGQQMQLTSWSRDKLPQYIWIALILDALGRDPGLITLGQIMQDLNKQEICIAELSKVLSLEDKKQRAWYAVINSYIPKRVLSPLSVVFSSRKYPYFFDCYCSPEIDVDEKISTLMNVIDKNLSFHSNESTDVCFIINWFYATSKTLSIAQGCSMIADALSQYHKHSHDDDIMRSYRPSIRAMVQGLGFDLDTSFSHIFWDELAQITSCRPIVFRLSQEGEHMNREFYEDMLKTLEYINATSRDKIQSSKFTVIMGITTYAAKLYSDIINHELCNTVSGRIIFRTITEAYINLKYIVQKEGSQTDIYDMFQNYGTGKYKLVMAKLREGKYVQNGNSHIDAKLLELYVNELKDENFLEISLGYFDKDSIKKKFDIVGEQELYEIYYEYDTNYTHAFWGAIRESSMLLCENPAHLYHVVPDYTFEQELININEDCIMILKKIFKYIAPFVELPDFYLAKYGESDA